MANLLNSQNWKDILFYLEILKFSSHILVKRLISNLIYFQYTREHTNFIAKENIYLNWPRQFIVCQVSQNQLILNGKFIKLTTLKKHTNNFILKFLNLVYIFWWRGQYPIQYIFKYTREHTNLIAKENIYLNWTRFMIVCQVSQNQLNKNGKFIYLTTLKRHLILFRNS